MWFWIIAKVISAYIIATSVFLVMALFFTAPRKRIDTFLDRANLFILSVLLMYIVTLGFGFVEFLLSNEGNSDAIDGDILQRSKRNHIYSYPYTLCLVFLFQLLFFIRRNRVEISLTIVSIILLTAVQNFEWVVILITRLYRDYLPSSWSVYYRWTDELWSLLFSAIYFLICWNSWQINKSGKTATKQTD